MRGVINGWCFSLLLGPDIRQSLQQLGCHYIRSSQKSTRGCGLFSVCHVYNNGTYCFWALCHSRAARYLLEFGFCWPSFLRLL